MTPTELARVELGYLLSECRGGLVLDENGFLQYYDREARKRVYFEPTWNGFDHPIHNLDQPHRDVAAVAAMQIITSVMRMLFR